MLGKAPAEAEGDTNLSPRRQAWAEAHLDEPTRRPGAARCRGLLASIRLHALPVGDPPRRGNLDRGPARAGGTWIFTATTSTMSATAIPG